MNGVNSQQILNKCEAVDFFKNKASVVSLRNAIMHFCVNNLILFETQLERDNIEVWQCGLMC